MSAMADILIATTPAELGRAIRTARQRQKRAQAWVAEHAGGLSRQTMIDLEAGGSVSVQTQASVLVALGLTMRMEPKQVDFRKLRKITAHPQTTALRRLVAGQAVRRRRRRLLVLNVGKQLFNAGAASSAHDRVGAVPEPRLPEKSAQMRSVFLAQVA